MRCRKRRARCPAEYCTTRRSTPTCGCSCTESGRPATVARSSASGSPTASFSARRTRRRSAPSRGLDAAPQFSSTRSRRCRPRCATAASTATTSPSPRPQQGYSPASTSATSPSWGRARATHGAWSEVRRSAGLPRRQAAPSRSSSRLPPRVQTTAANSPHSSTGSARSPSPAAYSPRATPERRTCWTPAQRHRF